MMCRCQNGVLLRISVTCYWNIKLTYLLKYIMTTSSFGCQSSTDSAIISADHIRRSCILCDWLIGVELCQNIYMTFLIAFLVLADVLKHICFQSSDLYRRRCTRTSRTGIMCSVILMSSGFILILMSAAWKFTVLGL